jgi:histidinol dehydrogenase
VALRILTIEDAADQRTFDSLVEKLRSQTAAGGEIARAVAEIIEDVKHRGDEALVHYMRKWTNPMFTDEMIKVDNVDMAAAEQLIDPTIRAAMRRSIEHVRTYQQHVMPTDPPTVEVDGAQLGMRFTPFDRVGLAIPGGKAAYPSTVIMSAVPAQVAGVEDICVVCPPPTGGGEDADVSHLVLGVCHMLGVTEVYRLGGAQAMAALAFGTETVAQVDFIAGPGNAFVQQAKRQLFGTVGIDGFYGPSEVVVLADDSADPVKVAADLLAQAEHDPGSCFLIGTDRAVIDRIDAEVERQLPDRQRRGAIEQSLADWSCAVVAPDDDAALKLVDLLAAEHVTLAVEDPHATLGELRHGGAWFLGDGTPVASGDYYAGPSHCLPTGTTARFTSGISVYTFLKRSSVEHYPAGLSRQAIDDITLLAEAEGLEAHAASVRARRR